MVGKAAVERQRLPVVTGMPTNPLAILVVGKVLRLVPGDFPSGARMRAKVEPFGALPFLLFGYSVTC